MATPPWLDGATAGGGQSLHNPISTNHHMPPPHQPTGLSALEHVLGMLDSTPKLPGTNISMDSYMPHWGSPASQTLPNYSTPPTPVTNEAWYGASSHQALSASYFGATRESSALSSQSFTQHLSQQPIQDQGFQPPPVPTQTPTETSLHHSAASMVQQNMANYYSQQTSNSLLSAASTNHWWPYTSHTDAQARSTAIPQPTQPSTDNRHYDPYASVASTQASYYPTSLDQQTSSSYPTLPQAPASSQLSMGYGSSILASSSSFNSSGLSAGYVDSVLGGSAAQQSVDSSASSLLSSQQHYLSGISAAQQPSSSQPQQQHQQPQYGQHQFGATSAGAYGLSQSSATHLGSSCAAVAAPSGSTTGYYDSASAPTYCDTTPYGPVKNEPLPTTSPYPTQVSPNLVGNTPVSSAVASAQSSQQLYSSYGGQQGPSSYSVSQQSCHGLGQTPQSQLSIPQQQSHTSQQQQPHQYPPITPPHAAASSLQQPLQAPSSTAPEPKKPRRRATKKGKEPAPKDPVAPPSMMRQQSVPDLSGISSIGSAQYMAPPPASPVSHNGPLAAPSALSAYNSYHSSTSGYRSHLDPSGSLGASTSMSGGQCTPGMQLPSSSMIHNGTNVGCVGHHSGNNVLTAAAGGQQPAVGQQINLSSHQPASMYPVTASTSSFDAQSSNQQLIGAYSQQQHQQPPASILPPTMPSQQHMTSPEMPPPGVHQLPTGPPRGLKREGETTLSDDPPSKRTASDEAAAGHATVREADDAPGLQHHHQQQQQQQQQQPSCTNTGSAISEPSGAAAAAASASGTDTVSAKDDNVTEKDESTQESTNTIESAKTETEDDDSSKLGANGSDKARGNTKKECAEAKSECDDGSETKAVDGGGNPDEKPSQSAGSDENSSKEGTSSDKDGAVKTGETDDENKSKAAQRRNIKDIKDEASLDERTKRAQKEEKERMERVQKMRQRAIEKQKALKDKVAAVESAVSADKADVKVESALPEGGETSDALSTTEESTACLSNSALSVPNADSTPTAGAGKTSDVPVLSGAEYRNTESLIDSANTESVSSSHQLPADEKVVGLVSTDEKTEALTEDVDPVSKSAEVKVENDSESIDEEVTVVKVEREDSAETKPSTKKRERDPGGDVIELSSGDEDEGELGDSAAMGSKRDVINVSDESGDDSTKTAEEEGEDDGDDEEFDLTSMAVLPIRDDQGRVLVNVGHDDDEEDVYIAPQLAAIIKPHQIGGVRFLYENVVESRERFDSTPGFGCILAHSMGLGKTIQVITFTDVFLRHTSARKVLVITPINTIQNWQAEFDKWVPRQDQVHPSLISDGHVRPRNYQVFLLNEAFKTTAARHRVVKDWDDKGGVILMGYEMYRMLALRKAYKPKGRRKTSARDAEECLRKDRELLEEVYEALVNPGPDLVVCDEGHRIKNCNASTSTALKDIRTRRRVVLTGYPLQNNLIEYWCMVDFVRPAYLGTKMEFTNMFERPIQNGQCVDSTPTDQKLMRFRAHVLHSLLVGFVQRRSHSVLKDALPHKEEHVIMIRMTDIQRKLYSTLVREFVTDADNSANPLKIFAVCCKIWNHPDILYNLVRNRQGLPSAAIMDLDIDEGLTEGSAGTASAAGGGSGLAAASTPPKSSSAATSVTGPAGDDSESHTGLAQPPPTAVVEGDDNSNKDEATNGKRKPRTRKKKEPAAPPPSAESTSKVDDDFNKISYEWAYEILADYKPDDLANSHKLVLLMEIVDTAMKMGDKLLVFSQSLLTLDLVERFLQARDLPPRPGLEYTDKWVKNRTYFRLDGSTSGQEREKMINDFNHNPCVSLFLLSTRAGCLGINLIGANRIVVLDASWNPCHDAQAVCRVYRYGQQKQCFIYRFVCDNSLEKRIYDRQVNKQGMSDRVVDEMNPEAKLTSKDVSTLILKDEVDPPLEDFSDKSAGFEDPIMKQLVTSHSSAFTKLPFAHESLLLDQKDKKLSKLEKKLAKASYEREKAAQVMGVRGTMVNGMRASYAGYQPRISYKSGQVMQNPLATLGINTNHALVHQLIKQGMTVQKMKVPRSISIGLLNEDPVHVPAGSELFVMKTPRGVYLRLPCERVIAMRLPQTLDQLCMARPNPFNRNPLPANLPGALGMSVGHASLPDAVVGGFAGPSGRSMRRGNKPEIINLDDDSSTDVEDDRQQRISAAAKPKVITIESETISRNKGLYDMLTKDCKSATMSKDDGVDDDILGRMTANKDLQLQVTEVRTERKARMKITQRKRTDGGSANGESSSGSSGERSDRAQLLEINGDGLEVSEVPLDGLEAVGIGKREVHVNGELTAFTDVLSSSGAVLKGGATISTGGSSIGGGSGGGSGAEDEEVFDLGGLLGGEISVSPVKPVKKVKKNLAQIKADFDCDFVGEDPEAEVVKKNSALTISALAASNDNSQGSVVSDASTESRRDMPLAQSLDEASRTSPLEKSLMENSADETSPRNVPAVQSDAGAM